MLLLCNIKDTIFPFFLLRKVFFWKKEPSKQEKDLIKSKKESGRIGNSELREEEALRGMASLLHSGIF